MQALMDGPKQRLSKDSVKVWIISETIGNLIGFVILATLFVADQYYSWYDWIEWVLIALTVLSVGSTIWAFYRASLLYKHWRYDVNEEYLQLKSGALHEQHHIIPMTKIQSVSTHQGPLLKRYNLYSVKINTVGSDHEIPALPKSKAFELRDSIAVYAKVEEVEI
ncbi:PH domain-containing protein [Halobacillus faecis]